MENDTNNTKSPILEDQHPAPEDPYKSMEFETFLGILEKSPANNWSIVAQGLGVGRLTIMRWRKHPRAQKILRDALQEVLDKMKEAGEADWRMWREYAKLLGVDDVHTIEVKDATGILDKLESDYAELGERAKVITNEKNTVVGEKPE